MLWTPSTKLVARSSAAFSQRGGQLLTSLLSAGTASAPIQHVHCRLIHTSARATSTGDGEDKNTKPVKYAMHPRKRTIDSYFTKPPSKKPVAPTAENIEQRTQEEIQNPTSAGESIQDTPGCSTAATVLTAPNAAASASAALPAVASSMNGLPAANAAAPAASADEAPPAQQPPGANSLLELLLEPTWRSVLAEEFSKPYFQSLQRFVAEELGSGKSNIYPPREHIFRAFNSCPFDEVKVVILGQDPYHGAGQAMGLSFSVPRGVAIPSSLRNIFKELRDDLGCKMPSHGNLEKWSQQGVLLLNAVLTVRAGNAASHSKKGWEQVTDAAIRQLAARRKGVVFLLWGRFAQDKAKLINTQKHHVLTAAHPSGLSAHKGFFGCQHFSKANKLLSPSQQPIDWSIDE